MFAAELNLDIIYKSAKCVIKSEISRTYDSEPFNVKRDEENLIWSPKR